MNIPGTFFLVITGFAIVAIGYGLSRAILSNSRTGKRYRDRVLDCIKPLRLHKMLAAIGIDDKEYLYKTRLADIKTHMRRCDQCGEKQVCDEQLEQGTISHADQYCPNHEDLVRLNQSR
jgi:hypothetical protein